MVGCTALSPGCTPSSPPQNIADQNRPINAPAWTVATKAAYTWQLPAGPLVGRVGWDWRSFTKVANTTASVTDQPAYGLLEAGLAFTTSSGAWRFALDGKNLLDTRIYAGPAAGAASVLCLHGLTRNSRDFEDLAPHLQQRYRVIVPDVRGRGLSARDPNPQN